MSTRQDRWKKRNPWERYLTWARQRCNNPKNKVFKNYGGRGIRCELTLAEIRGLWDKNKAEKLKKPSLDRIDSDGNYAIGNVRFIEFCENVTGLKFHPYMKAGASG